jgi:hypothetical protein
MILVIVSFFKRNANPQATAESDHNEQRMAL